MDQARTTEGPFLRVEIRLRSGAVQRFQVSEPIFRHLERLAARGLNGAELCSEWIPMPMRGDPPKHVRIEGELANGKRVSLAFDCETDSGLHPEDRRREIDGAPYDRRTARPGG